MYVVVRNLLLFILLFKLIWLYSFSIVILMTSIDDIQQGLKD